MLFQIKEFFNRLRLIGKDKEKGQTLIEYALLVLLIAIVVIAILVLLGPQIATIFNNIRTRLANPT